MKRSRAHSTHSGASRTILAALTGISVVLGAACWAGPAWAVPTKVTWEAEKPVKREDPWMIKSASKNEKKHKLVAGDSYIRHPMIWPPKSKPKDAKLDPTLLVYEFTVPRTDTYYFWAKTWWYDECHNSFWIGFDKDVPAADWASLSHDERTPREKAYLFGEDAIYKRWHWVRFHSGDLAAGGGIKLTSGKHKLYVRAREDGLSIDRFLLISDRDYVAMGQNG
jgi:hypothetical protein